MFDSFDVSARRTDGITTIVARGELDVATAPCLQTALDLALWEEARGRHVVLDLTAVSFCDSAGLSVLLTASQLSAINGTSFEIVVDDGHVRDALELSGVVERLPLVASGDRLPPAPLRPGPRLRAVR